MSARWLVGSALGRLVLKNEYVSNQKPKNIAQQLKKQGLGIVLCEVMNLFTFYG